MLGAFIVREPLELTGGELLYDEDRSDHVMFISSWADVSEIDRYMEEMQDKWKQPIPVNGTSFSSFINFMKQHSGLINKCNERKTQEIVKKTNLNHQLA